MAANRASLSRVFGINHINMKYIFTAFLLGISMFCFSQSKELGKNYLDKGKAFLEFNNIDSANHYLQLAVQNRNSEAINLLRQELQIDIEYHDIMPKDIIDENPKFLHKNKEYPIHNNDYTANAKLMTQIRKVLLSSDVLKKSKFTGRVFLELIIDKEGNFIGDLKRGTGNKALDKNIIDQLRNKLKFKPAIYKGQNTGAWGYIIGLKF